MPVPLLKLRPSAEAITSDADLLGRFTAHRDEAAFAELVRRYGPLVHRLCRRLSPAVADDAFQTVFLTLACRAGSIHAPGALAGWLVGVGGRIARRMRRAEESRAERERAAGRTAVTAQEPNNLIEGADLAAALDDELSRLPERLRDPIVLCLVRGRTHEQAAAELGGSARTLRRRLEQARAVLRARLERRGVVPAVAAALITGASAPARAVPTGLVRQTVSSVFQVLDGGPGGPGLAVAKGAVSNMVRFKVSALVATASAVLLYLGAGWSNDDAPPTSPVPLIARAARGQQPAARPQADAPTVPAAPAPPAEAETPVAAEGGSFRTPNFVVRAPTAVMARVLASEAEYHRRALALAWLGQELPKWSNPCVIRFTQGVGGNGGATTFTYGKSRDGAPILALAGMELRGDFMTALSSTLPHEVMHTVLASHFAAQLPRWADEGIALLAESDEEQRSYDVRVRELLNAGRGVRVKVLLPMTEYPRDLLVLYAQGHSLARFLASDSAPTGAAVLKDLPRVGKLFQNGTDGRRRLLAFVQLGTDGNTAESWAKAASAVYGFKSLDDLEEAWLAWLAKPESAIKSRPVGPHAPRKEKRDEDLIPPTELPNPQPGTAPLAPEAVPPTIPPAALRP